MSKTAKRELARQGLYEVWLRDESGKLDLYQFGQSWNDAQNIAAYLRRNGNRCEVVQQTQARE